METETQDSLGWAWVIINLSFPVSSKGLFIGVPRGGTKNLLLAQPSTDLSSHLVTTHVVKQSSNAVLLGKASSDLTRKS